MYVSVFQAMVINTQYHVVRNPGAYGSGESVHIYAWYE